MSDRQALLTTDRRPARLDVAEPTTAVSRAALVAFLEWRVARGKVLRQVPLSLLLYVVFAAGIVLRAQVGASFEFESDLVQSVVRGLDANATFAPRSATEWYRWMDGTLISRVLPANASDGSPLPQSQLGRLANGNALVIGGVRLMQTRRPVAPCPLGSSQLVSLYGAPCYGTESASGTGPFGNVAVATQYGVGSAFVPTTVAGDGEAPEYQLFLNPETGPQAMSRLVEGLRLAGWVDGGTASVGIQIALLNGNVGLFGRVELSAQFTAGGMVLPSTSVTSIPVDPYYASTGVTILFDVAMLLYWLYLLQGTARRLAKATCRRPEGPGWGRGHADVSPSRVAVLCEYWRLLDVATVVSLLVTQCLWFAVVSQLSSIRRTIDDAHPAGPADFAGGPSPLAFVLLQAHETFASFKVSAVVTIALLTLRLFKYFRYQPRLAVLSTAIARGLSDFLHVALLFGLVLAAYGIVGHFSFGTQAADWRDVRSSCVAIFKNSVYVNNLGEMQRAFPALADVYFNSYMILVTNFVYVLAFASVFSAYDKARLAARAQGPSAFADLAAFIACLPRDAYVAAAPVVHSIARWAGTGQQLAVRYLPIPASAGLGSLVRTMLHAARQGALPDEVVTASAVATSFRVAPATAVELLRQAAAHAEEAAASAARVAAEVQLLPVLQPQLSLSTLDSSSSHGWNGERVGSSSSAASTGAFPQQHQRSVSSFQQADAAVFQQHEHPRSFFTVASPSLSKYQSSSGLSSSPPQAVVDELGTLRSAVAQLSEQLAAQTRLLAALQTSMVQPGRKDGASGSESNLLGI